MAKVDLERQEEAILSSHQVVFPAWVLVLVSRIFASPTRFRSLLNTFGLEVPTRKNPCSRSRSLMRMEVSFSGFFIGKNPTTGG